jgi:hypothetical protein
MSEAGLRADPSGLDARLPRSPSVAPIARPVKPSAPMQEPPVAKAAPVEERPDTDWQVHEWEPELPAPRWRRPANLADLVPPDLRKFLQAALMAATFAGGFAAAQFVSAPAWLFRQTGTLIVESDPPGVQVLVNGKHFGVTPLALEMQGGRHEVELRGPGQPRTFNVFVSGGDRVAQYVEFQQTRRR